MSKNNPHYDNLPYETKKRFDEAMKGGDPTKKKKSKTVDYFTEDNNGPV